MYRKKHKKLLDDLKDRRGYCQLKEEALDRTMWRNRFGRGFGPVVWQNTDDYDDYDDDDDVDVSLLCQSRKQEVTIVKNVVFEALNAMVVSRYYETRVLF